ncbi:MAG TPA: Gfo/Idh/MocA family oxidoreductase [Chitinophagaceae bacterium]|nr:Gfo/Idh/MocA family oxidoreductase [Chitinophagaceae bacterium]
MPVNELTFAITGCGRIAERHAAYIQKVGKLAAVCDIDAQKAEALGKKYNARVYYSHHDMLKSEKGLSVASVCTPNGLHAQHSISALNAGIDVLCEKPMAITSYDCGEMIKAAERNNRRLFIVKQNRFNPPVMAVKQAIDNGIMGRIYSVHVNCFWNRGNNYYTGSWRGTKALDGGTLFTQFSHFIDLLYWMIGDVKKVQCLTRNFAHNATIEFEDTGIALLEFYNNAMGNINFTINSFEKNMEGSVTIFAENGTVKIGGQYLNELEYQDIKGYVIKDLPKGNPANDYGAYSGSMSNHDKVYQNLADVLQNGAAISTNAFEGLKTVEIIEKIYASAKISR